MKNEALRLLFSCFCNFFVYSHLKDISSVELFYVAKAVQYCRYDRPLRLQVYELAWAVGVKSFVFPSPENHTRTTPGSVNQNHHEP